MVTGRVAPLELVEKARSCAGARPLKKVFQPRGVQRRRSSG